ncbi:MAG: class I SAM-dependent methyltransferase [Synergistes sp.]|nr:class I SAM-dependent methyltransferase [Synergistes sp.]
MSITTNFSHPKGLLGRLMLTTMNMGHTPMAKWGFTQFDVPETGVIADLGCGGGMNVRRLLAMSPGARVYGFDISAESVAKTEKLNKKDLGKRCKVLQGSVEKLPFKAGTLDLATAFETVYFWPDLERSFAEVRRVIREGGRFVVVNDPGDPSQKWDEKIPGMTSYTAKQIKDYMEKAGFTDITISKDKNTYCVIGYVR